MSPGRLNDLLLHTGSATAVLEELCRGPVHIRRLDSPAPPTRLQQPTTHRHVEIIHNQQTLSTAHLWYRQALLPEEMLKTLAETDTPFGRVVRPLNLRRQTLHTRLGNPGDSIALEHHAILTLPNGQAVAEVLEHYSWALIS